MQIIGDLHTRQQTLAILDTRKGEVREKTLVHEGHNVRKFYFALPRPVRVEIEATGAMQWFVNLMEGLGIEYQLTRRRFGRPSPGSRNRIGEMRT